MKERRGQVERSETKCRVKRAEILATPTLFRRQMGLFLELCQNLEESRSEAVSNGKSLKEA